MSENKQPHTNKTQKHNGAKKNRPATPRPTLDNRASDYPAIIAYGNGVYAVRTPSGEMEIQHWPPKPAPLDDLQPLTPEERERVAKGWTGGV